MKPIQFSKSYSDSFFFRYSARALKLFIIFWKSKENALKKNSDIFSCGKGAGYFLCFVSSAFGNAFFQSNLPYYEIFLVVSLLQNYQFFI